jgi:hypothetical protein
MMATKRIAGFHADMAKAMKGQEAIRGTYDEIMGFGRVPGTSPWSTEPFRPTTYAVKAVTILDFFRPCLVDEYCSFDRKKRGGALNHDLYAYDPKQRVAIVQTREAFRGRAKHFLEVRKTYFLVGFNELTKAPFRHPLGAHQVRAAVRKHGTDQAAIVRTCQCWMFDVTEKQLAASIRQGDVLLTPVRAAPEGEELGSEARLDSHVIEAAEVRKNGALYARDLTIRHEKGQHRTVVAEGWHRVVMAREAKAWEFARRLGD